MGSSRRRLLGIELTGARRHVRHVLVCLVAAGAALALAGGAMGRVRVRTGSPPDGWGEWHSMAVETWFIPVQLAFAVLVYALAVRRRRPPTGFILGCGALVAFGGALFASQGSAILDVNAMVQLGYLGNLLMAGWGLVLLVAEPLVSIAERRARARAAPTSALPEARDAVSRSS
jgi:hypothetical protein